MGSCCSSIAKGKSGSNRDGLVASARDTTTCASPKKKKQRQGSGRWRKKPSGLVPMEEAELHLIPGRMFLNGASSVTCLYTQQGKKGTNQDAMLVWENFSSRSDTIFCGVFDGHGPFGHMVSNKVRDSLPIILCTQWKTSLTGDQSSLNKSENAPESTVSEDAASLSMDDECFDGTTAVTLVKQGQDLVIGNIGDSRAVLAMRDKDNSLIAIQLTVDLKPDLPREAARIQQCKGRVFSLQDEPEVARVWLPNNDSPGLAMARAFGDFCLKDFGLISMPDVFYRRLTERDEFIILATDGVWDVLSNKEAIDIVASAPSRSTAARALVDCATQHGDLKEKNNITRTPKESGETTVAIADNKRDSQSLGVAESDTFHGCMEIVPVTEESEERSSWKLGGQSRSLAEHSVAEEEWSALEGITRVNSLLSLPRFLSGDKRSTSLRKNG
ncbi:putative protein phosphatase 2C 18 [Hibiscus syriacus]|uniref:PPM-type phosphatase domain-containing protein n=1 Tax=Hibiscus syriacus TaxID=106335 RepID=A0A6A3CTF6_HIBSY|nr:putative protein phosphatase 2C 18 [Hibiscus syriacus]